MERITSRQNSLVAQIRKLNSDKKTRRAAGLLVGEGPKLLEEALRARIPVTTLVTDGSYSRNLGPEVRQVEVPRDLLETLCDTRTPQGVLFLAEAPDTSSPDKLSGRRYLVLDEVQDPGNVGTIWRTADALGTDGLLLVNGCADPYSPKVVRATMGACFRLPAYEVESKALFPLLEQSGLPLYGTALREDTVNIRTVQLDRCAVVIGSEGRGISQSLLDRCEKTLKIPMRQRCESLNAAVAASIVLWEMGRSEV